MLFMDIESNKSQEKDINDVFDSIAFLEEQISNEAFQEGLNKGTEEGKFEGYHLGFHKGLQLGTEVGFYKGLIQVLQSKHNVECSKKGEKIQTLLEKLRYLLNDFPKHCQDVDILKQIGDIRANYKKLNSLLKLNLSFPPINPGMSF